MKTCGARRYTPQTGGFRPDAVELPTALFAGVHIGDGSTFMTAMLPRAPTEVTRTKLQRSTEISENTARNEPVAVARTVFRTISDPDPSV